MSIHGVFLKNDVINHQENHNCVSFTYINMTNYNFSGGAPVSKLSKRAQVGIQTCSSAIWFRGMCVTQYKTTETVCI